jgi:hypothetical protein
MNELYMSLAAFVYYARRNGFNFQKQRENTLTFNYDGGRYYFSKIMPGKNGLDCGYIVVSKHDFNLLFGNDVEYNKDLNNCKKIKDEKKSEHCGLPEHLWGRIETEIRPGETINCQKEKQDIMGEAV